METQRWTGVYCQGGDTLDGHWRKVLEHSQRLAKAAAVVPRHSSSAKLDRRLYSHILRDNPTGAAVWQAWLRLHRLRGATIEAEGRMPQGANMGILLHALRDAGFRIPWVVHAVEVIKSWSSTLGQRLLGEAVQPHCMDGARVA